MATVKATSTLDRIKKMQADRGRVKVTNITSDTVDVPATLIDKRSYDFVKNTGEKVAINRAELLLGDVTELLPAGHPSLKGTVMPDGTPVLALARVELGNAEEGKSPKLWFRISKTSKFDEQLKSWQTLVPPLKDYPDTHVCLEGNSLLSVKIAAPLSGIATSTPVHVTLSALKWLPPFPESGKPLPDPSTYPTEVGLRIMAESVKSISMPNAPLMFKAFLNFPRMCRFPVPSYEELKVLDDIKYIGDKTYGKRTVTIPFLPTEETALKMAAAEVGCLSQLQLPDNHDNPNANPFAIMSVKKGRIMRCAKLEFICDQWKQAGGSTETFMAKTTFWEDEVAAYGITNTGIWQDLAPVVVAHTPMFIQGVVDYEDSEKCSLNKLSENPVPGKPQFMLTLRGGKPMMDFADAIMKVYGIPVSPMWCRLMTTRSSANGSYPADFIWSPNDKNPYNASDDSEITVVNELPTSAAIDGLFTNVSADIKFFAVCDKQVDDYTMDILRELRELQDSNEYVGPLGEMLLHKNWNPGQPANWSKLVWGEHQPNNRMGWSKDDWDIVGTIPPTHPVVTKHVAKFRTKDGFYIFAIDTSIYSQKLSDAKSASVLVGNVDSHAILSAPLKKIECNGAGAHQEQQQSQQQLPIVSSPRPTSAAVTQQQQQQLTETPKTEGPRVEELLMAPVSRKRGLETESEEESDQEAKKARRKLDFSSSIHSEY